MTQASLTDEECQRALDVHAAQGGSASRAAKILGCNGSTLGRRIREARRRGLTPKVKDAGKDTGRRRSKNEAVAAFRAQCVSSFIIPAKIEAALKKLGQDWTYEPDFLKLAEVSPLHAAPYKEQFADFHFQVSIDGRKKTVWCGTRALASELRAEVQR